MIQTHLLPEDLADPRDPLPGGSRVVGRQLRIGWIATPPIAGSGGHTTAFRMVQALESAGHECDLVLYDPFGGDLAEREAVIRRSWPELRARVRAIGDGFHGLDACIATGWQTAHALASRTRTESLHRLYFVQDYEPFFYPHGFEYSLAEQTYQFGFHNIALGGMVSRHLERLGVPYTTVPFGCDTRTYRLLGATDRSGIVFYSRAGTSRRGHLLATLGMTEFHRRRPDVPIRVFGPLERTEFDFPITWEGLLTPPELNALYNSAVCGLGMSFTNVSLVAGEMLAAGCVPIVNDSIDARLDLSSPFVRWVLPTPTAVADAIEGIVDNPPDDTARIAESVPLDWTETASRFVGVVERVGIRS